MTQERLVTGTESLLSYSREGVAFHRHQLERRHSHLVAYLSQLEEEGHACFVGDAVQLRWSTVYMLQADSAHGDSFPLLSLPPIAPIVPILTHTGGLSDPTFRITASGWRYTTGSPLRSSIQITGGLIEINNEGFLLKENTWRLLVAVDSFSSLSQNDKTAEVNRSNWAIIRQLAISAEAVLDNYLAHTVVVSPSTLSLRMRKVDITGTRVVEVIPEFSGMPDGWLRVFDGYERVQDRYDVPEGQDLVQVLIEPTVKTVLSEIKRMPGRRVAGPRAEAFVRNPYAVLGADAGRVINEEEFVKSREDAGVFFCRFTAHVCRDEVGICGASLLIESLQHGNVVSETYQFRDIDDLKAFVLALEERLSKGMQCCAWEGWDLDLLGDTEDQLRILRNALAEWSRPRLQIRLSDVHDLSHYTQRIEGLGQEKPYYSPYIARKKDDDGWYPDNVILGVFWTPEGTNEPVGINIPPEELGKFKELVVRARGENKASIDFPPCPNPIPTEEAARLLSTLEGAYADVQDRSFPSRKEEKETGTDPRQRPSLVIKPNIEHLEYREERRRIALAAGQNLTPSLPAGLRSEVNILDHQLKGIARLQHLYKAAPDFCRGVLLADDMGLGKTLQVLTFIAKCFEDDQHLDPALIVAPVSLLDNWKIEIDNFFKPKTFIQQTLYGSSLQKLKVSKEDIDEQLLAEGLTRFLRPSWRGDANLVLTTYETLRDLEFSMASQHWSIMVCDEAQKIKNANALVTRAAKKQNVTFKIACTGTPVENSLADLWCLFDFIQPGELGSLNEFGSRYRRPIEAKSDEERIRIDELRKLIEPQVIRRTKREVAKDLPNKLAVDSCMGIPMSPYQKGLYSHAISLFKSQSFGSPSRQFANHLGLLQHLRRICADPRPLGLLADLAQPYEEYASRSPKMKWLVAQLEQIKSRKEKAIIFTEYRDVQRIIQGYVQEKLGVKPDIINGDTTASSQNDGSRQKKLDAFQRLPGFGVIILSPLAVGFGVNIQAANHVIHYTRTWNPAKEDQATDRAYRIGQRRDVYVYCPTITDSSFKTFEKRLDELLTWKRHLSEDMLNGTGELAAGDFGGIEGVDGDPIMKDRSLSIDDVSQMDPDTFEVFCTLLWLKQGFPISYRTPKSGDGGIDVVAINGNKGALIQAKSSLDEGKKLGWDAVKDVVAGEAAYNRKHPGIVFKKYSVTNQCFNSDAVRQAEINEVTLIDKGHLVGLLARYPIQVLELEKHLL